MNKPMRIMICLCCAHRDDKITHVSSSIYVTFVRSNENELFFIVYEIWANNQEVECNIYEFMIILSFMSRIHDQGHLSIYDEVMNHFLLGKYGYGV